MTALNNGAALGSRSAMGADEAQVLAPLGGVSLCGRAANRRSQTVLSELIGSARHSKRQGGEASGRHCICRHGMGGGAFPKTVSQLADQSSVWHVRSLLTQPTPRKSGMS